MQVRAEELGAALAKGLAPCVVVSGDEPLQCIEAADLVRQAARKSGYDERLVFDVERDFDWNGFEAETASLSLFGSLRLIELRLHKAPDAAAGAALRRFAEHPPTDTLLLITTPRLERRHQQAAWYKALDRIGVIVNVWPVDIEQLPRWIEQRMRAAGLRCERAAAMLLAERVEGNLLAAAQQVERLRLLAADRTIDAVLLAELVADNARYDSFKLIDSALAGDARRALRILSGLRAEGEELLLVLGAISAELRRLIELGEAIRGGMPPDQAVQKICRLPRRKPLMRQALARITTSGAQQLLGECLWIDAAAKGAGPIDGWQRLEQLLLTLSGARKDRAPTGSPATTRQVAATRPAPSAR